MHRLSSQNGDYYLPPQQLNNKENTFTHIAALTVTISPRENHLCRVWINMRIAVFDWYPFNTVQFVHARMVTLERKRTMLGGRMFTKQWCNVGRDQWADWSCYIHKPLSIRRGYWKFYVPILRRVTDYANSGSNLNGAGNSRQVPAEQRRAVVIHERESKRIFEESYLCR